MDPFPHLFYQLIPVTERDPYGTLDGICVALTLLPHG
jgi:hypothetical protein